jgi:hypothetical protein
MLEANAPLFKISNGSTVQNSGNSTVLSNVNSVSSVPSGADNVLCSVSAQCSDNNDAVSILLK